MSEKTKEFDLIVTIVKKGFSEQIIQASIKAGAKGGTVLFGRGTGIHEKRKYWVQDRKIMWRSNLNKLMIF